MRNIHTEERMSKKEKKHKTTRTKPGRRRRRSKLWPIGILVFAAGLILAVVFSLPKSEPWGLPAIPQSPRPTTLSWALFSGDAAKAYQIAQEAPELLERMPCYCGCYVNPGHRNNLDCYTDRHGAG